MNDGITEIIATWKGENKFDGKNSSGSILHMGEEGDNPGIPPMQLLLFALAGCTGIDIVSILRKKRVKLTDMQVKVIGKRAKDFPMIWNDIHVSYLLTGNEIRSKDVEQAIKLSEEKYCFVGIMLGESAKITSDYSIFNQ